MASSMVAAFRRPSVLIVLAAAATGASASLLGVCGPFTDVAAKAVCRRVLEIFYLGITTGTTATTYDPAGNVSRLQMAAFLSRGVDNLLRRAGKRAALRQFATPAVGDHLGSTTIHPPPVSRWNAMGPTSGSRAARTEGRSPACGGATERCSRHGPASLSGNGILVALGRIYVAGATMPGRLYAIDPSQPAGVVTTVANNLGASPSNDHLRRRPHLVCQRRGTVSLVAPGIGDSVDDDDRHGRVGPRRDRSTTARTFGSATSSRESS